MTPDWMRRSSIADYALLFCVIGLTLATWAAFSHASGVPAWKAHFSVSATMFLALAALTPRQHWALGVRLAMSLWLIAAPWLLGFVNVPSAWWIWPVAGSVIAALSAPRWLKRGDRGFAVS